MDDALLLALWGKTKDRSAESTEYHPLLFHLIDVGVAAEALWAILARSVRQRLIGALGVSEDETRRAVTLLAALHDLGKASGFQGKVEPLWDALQVAGLTIERVNAGEHHAFVTAASRVLPRLLKNTDACGVMTTSPRLANALARSIGAHHGTFPPGENLFDAAVLGGVRWDEVREALARRVASALFPGAPPVTLRKPDLDDPAAGVLLTGLVAVADWIGSNQDYFALSAERDIDAYAAQAREVARKALDGLGWTPVPQYAVPQPFHEMVWARDREGRPIRFVPRGVQTLVEGMATQADGPYLMICEAAMGEGKTEAALFCIDRATTTGWAHGAGVEMPTQATGNAMLDRVSAYLENRGHRAAIHLQLVHGGAEFHEGFAKLRLAANGRGGSDEAPVVAESWFTNKKQALLAPFGVGTIDQSLLGVLQTKHWFVRLFGLAGKVIVFDEVHAYHAYMNALLRRLIRWLSALDCTVVLLSATLPQKTRQELIDAYAPGVTLPDASYPRVTFVPKVGPPSCRSVADPDTRCKRVALRFAPPDYAGLAAQLRSDLPAGGCAVVVCNTVRNAQAAYAAFLAALGSEGWEVELFHARTPLRWRKDRERAVLDKLGKPGRARQRPAKYILIGTQVLEQSLDYDADWMASEFAPVDLLLQRMGRLWRHERGPRPAMERRFTVLAHTPESGDALPSFPEGSDLIYARYLLLRTFLTLRNREEILLPVEIEPLVQAVYDKEAPEGLSGDWTAALKDSWDDLNRVEGDERGQAEANLVPDWRKRNGLPKDFAAIVETRGHLEDSDDPAIHDKQRATTRLGDPSLTLVCLRRLPDGRVEPFCGGKPFDLEKPASNRPVKELLLSAVSVSRPLGLFRALLGQKSPPGWEEDRHLRYARPVVFEGNAATVAGYALRLDESAGLSVEKEEAG